MKRVLGALLIMVTMKATTAIASPNPPDNTELVVTVLMDGDIGIINGYLSIFHPDLFFDGERVIDKSEFASVEGLTKVFSFVREQLINMIFNDNKIASVEGLEKTVPIVKGVLNDKIVNNDNVASVEGLIKVFSLSAVVNSTDGTNFSETFLPVEVGLRNSNIKI